MEIKRVTLEEEIESVQAIIENSQNISHITVCKSSLDEDDDELVLSDDYSYDYDEDQLNDSYGDDEDYKPGKFYYQTIEHFAEEGFDIQVSSDGTCLLIDASDYFDKLESSDDEED